MAAPKKTQILANSEITSLQEEKRELEAALKEIDDGAGSGTRGGSIDKDALRRQAKAIDQKIEAGSPVNVRGLAKDKMADRAKQLEEQFTVGMPTRDQMRNPGKYPGVIRQNYEWQKRNSSAIKEWKQLQRQLEPGDPTMPSQERLRRS